MLGFLLLQIQVSDAAAAAAPAQLELSLWEMALKGGWIMIPLALLWCIGLYIFFERFWSIEKASRIDANFMNQIKEFVIDDKLDAARSLCAAKQTPVANMIAKGIDRMGRPMQDLSTAVENVGNLARHTVITSRQAEFYRHYLLVNLLGRSLRSINVGTIYKYRTRRFGEFLCKSL